MASPFSSTFSSLLNNSTSSLHLLQLEVSHQCLCTLICDPHQLKDEEMLMGHEPQSVDGHLLPLRVALGHKDHSFVRSFNLLTLKHLQINFKIGSEEEADFALLGCHGDSILDSNSKFMSKVHEILR